MIQLCPLGLSFGSDCNSYSSYCLRKYQKVIFVIFVLPISSLTGIVGGLINFSLLTVCKYRSLCSKVLTLL